MKFTIDWNLVQLIRKGHRMCKILAVENDAQLKHTLSIALSREHEFAEVDNIADATKRLSHEEPDIIFIDLDSDSNVEQMLEFKDTVNSTIVFATSNGHEAGDLIGNHEYYILRKPFKINNLMDTIDRAALHHAVNNLMGGHTKKLDGDTLKSIRNVKRRLDVSRQET